MPPTVSSGVPDAATGSQILTLTAQVAARDGEPPLSDQALTQLRSDEVRHFLARDDERLIGYAQLDGERLEIAAQADAVEGLLDAAARDARGPLLVWAHGRGSVLGPILERRGLRQARVLHQLRRTLGDALPVDPPLADGISVRPFVPGLDEQAWLAVNAAAFAEHPEQGRWRLADLLAREAESWFDPDGLLLGERGDQLLGFHWTKIHPSGAGEVYVLGVAPAAQGLGLGAGLLIRGLRHLTTRGCPEVLLYVDDDNTAAMGLYEQLGFHNFDADVQWRAS